MSLLILLHACILLLMNKQPRRFYHIPSGD